MPSELGTGLGDGLRAGTGVLRRAARRPRGGRIGRVTAEGEVVPAGYAELLEQLKARVRSAQVRAARAANSEVLSLYWSVGRDILDRQDRLGWGGKVVDRLAGDLRAAFPDQRGWSRRTSSTCGPSRRPGRTGRTLCTRLVHNFPGDT